MKNYIIATIVGIFTMSLSVSSFSMNSKSLSAKTSLCMAVKNDPFAKANREMRRASGDDRYHLVIYVTFSL